MPNTEDIPTQALEEPSCTLPHFESFYKQPDPIDMTMSANNKSQYEGLNVLTERECKEEFCPPSLDESDKDYASLLPVSDLFQKIMEKPADLNSWTKTHPHEWKSQQVLDFIYSLAELTDGSGLRGENFQNIEGSKLCTMSCDELQKLEPQFGQTIYDHLQRLLKKSNFHPPNHLDSTDTELPGSPMDLTTLPPQTSGSSLMRELFAPMDENFLMDALKCPNSYMMPQEDSKQHLFLHTTCPAPPPPPSATLHTPNSPLPPTLGHSQPTDGGTFLYDFDALDKFDDHQDDSGYTSSAGSSTSSRIDYLPEGVPTPVLQLEFQNDLDSTPPSSLPGYQASLHKKCGNEGMVQKRRPGRPKRERLPSGSSSDGEAPVHKTRGRKPGQTSKGNHLWEFIRDLLKNASYSDIIKWEDQNDGVFRILKSSEVSQLWGKKKNNPNMNYEKLSRAMRHYYKTHIMEAVLGRRLVYRFGEKATGWRSTDQS